MKKFFNWLKGLFSVDVRTDFTKNLPQEQKYPLPISEFDSWPVLSNPVLQKSWEEHALHGHQPKPKMDEKKPEKKVRSIYDAWEPTIDEKIL